MDRNQPPAATSDPEKLVPAVAARLSLTGAQLAVAESCTGGLLSKLLTDRPGSSQWFNRGVITYSDAAKQDLLGVPAGVLEAHGAVSQETVSAMAVGLRARASVDWTLAVTGIAGPDGGTDEKPVGLVWIACSGESGVKVRGFRFEGDRDAIRRQASAAALQALLDRFPPPQDDEGSRR